MGGPSHLAATGAFGFRGGLVFKAHRLLYHSTLGLRVIKKKKKVPSGKGPYQRFWYKSYPLLIGIPAGIPLRTFYTFGRPNFEPGSYLRLVDFVYQSTIGLQSTCTRVAVEWRTLNFEQIKRPPGNTESIADAGRVWTHSRPSKGGQIICFHRLNLYHKSPDPGGRQHKPRN